MARKTILHRLFSSKARAQLVTALFSDPEREYYMRELARATGQVVGSVQRELDNLEEMNLVVSQRRANAKFYRANRNHYLYQEMKSIVAKTTGADNGVPPVKTP
jgi:DNA-binding MarR family transcriptional regulator